MAETLTDEQLDVIRTNACPWCGARESWLRGPQGGLATNIYCDNCGAGVNYLPPPFDAMFMDVICEPTRPYLRTGTRVHGKRKSLLRRMLHG